jgi:hypothetical protein
MSVHGITATGIPEKTFSESVAHADGNGTIKTKSKTKWSFQESFTS